MPDRDVRPRRGPLNQAIANAVVRGHSRYVGRGPTKAQAFFRENVVVVLLQDTLTKGERSLIAGGKQESVLHTRRQYQEMMRADLVDAVQELTGCRVEALLSGNHIDPDLSAEVFVLDRPVPFEQPPPADGAAG
jgi:uncharacterized protein YbcI